MSKILIVVHKISHSGGSERNCLLYATALHQMGHQVTILTNEIVGNFNNNIRITTDMNIINEKNWNLVIIHGDCNAQNYFLSQKLIDAPMLYLLVRPNDLPIIQEGMKNATKIGFVTPQDLTFVKKHGYLDKAISIRYPIECPTIKLTKDEIREKFNITEENFYISIGGYWDHKDFSGIAKAFCEAKPKNTELIFTGYDTRNNIEDYTKIGNQAGVKIQQFYIEDYNDVMELLSIANVSIFNAMLGTEGYCLSLIESLILRCPVLARTGIPAAEIYSHLSCNVYDAHEQLVNYMKNPFVYDKEYLQQISTYIQEAHDPILAAQSLLNGI